MPPHTWHADLTFRERMPVCFHLEALLASPVRVEVLALLPHAPLPAGCGIVALPLVALYDDLGVLELLGGRNHVVARQRFVALCVLLAALGLPAGLIH